MESEETKILKSVQEKIKGTRDFLNHQFLAYISENPVMEPMKWGWAIDTYKFIKAEKPSIPDEIYSLCNNLFLSTFQAEGQLFVEYCRQRIEILEKGETEEEIRKTILNQYEHWKTKFTKEANQTINSIEKLLNNTLQTNSDNYDIGLSFAGEDREYVEGVAFKLKELGIKVFYDSFEQDKLWGKNLYQHLNEIYKEKCRYTIIFISESYARKNWTNHELESAQARAFKENREYLLPVRFDTTSLPGMNETVGYLDATKYSAEEIALMAAKKLK